MNFSKTIHLTKTLKVMGTRMQDYFWGKKIQNKNSIYHHVNGYGRRHHDYDHPYFIYKPRSSYLQGILSYFHRVKKSIGGERWDGANYDHSWIIGRLSPFLSTNEEAPIIC